MHDFHENANDTLMLQPDPAAGGFFIATMRPDCLILQVAETFWQRFMEGGWPTFQPHKGGNQVLSGIYGTRFVEYLTVRRFDELERMPEVSAAHLQDAMRQLWSLAHV